MSHKNFDAKPMKDEWDIEFLAYVRDKADAIIDGKKDSAFKQYHERYNNIELRKSKNTGKKKYMGIIAHADDVKGLRYAVERKINNRSSVGLTDLHELYLCTEMSPNALFNIHTTETIAQLNYLKIVDIKNLSQNIDRMPWRVPFVVQCVPLLGLYLTVQADFEDRKKRLIYQIVDSFCIFSWPKTSSTQVAHTFTIPDPPIGDGEDGKMERTIEAIFKNALVIFEMHCALAKGILTNRNNVSIDCHKALSKDVNEEDLPVRKIANFLDLDSEHKIPNRDRFTTDSKSLENTINLFMSDVVSMRKEQQDVEQVKKRRATMEKGKGEGKQDLDTLIGHSEQQSNEGTKIKC